MMLPILILGLLLRSDLQEQKQMNTEGLSHVCKLCILTLTDFSLSCFLSILFMFISFFTSVSHKKYNLGKLAHVHSRQHKIYMKII